MIFKFIKSTNLFGTSAKANGFGAFGTAPHKFSFGNPNLCVTDSNFRSTMQPTISRFQTGFSKCSKISKDFSYLFIV